MIPTLILACDRLDTLTRVIDSANILNLGPVYVSCDAPRLGKNYENSKVVEFLEKQLNIGKISFLNIRAKNEGIAKAIEGGIDWFFSSVKFGVILEDDVVLKMNAHLVLTNGAILMGKDESIKAVNLRNTVPSNILTQRNQGFRRSTLVSSHGWATTSKNWSDFRKSEKELSTKGLFDQIPSFLGRFSILAFLESASKNENQRQTREYSWAFAWQVYIFKNRHYTLNSNHNFVDYIGYRSDSTHDQRGQRKKEELHEITDFYALDFESDAILEKFADRYRFKSDMRHTFVRYLIRKLRINRLIPNVFNW
jgi:hypothetical protein